MKKLLRNCKTLVTVCLICGLVGCATSKQSGGQAHSEAIARMECVFYLAEAGLDINEIIGECWGPWGLIDTN